MRKTEGPAGVALIGAGEFGATFLAQARRAAGLEVRLVCDRDIARARAALTSAGFGDDGAVFCSSRAEALAAVESGRIALIEDVTLLPELPLDAVVEATGDPEAAALTAELAIASGYHSILATKEAEVIAGAELARRAARAGLVHAPVEGDQPGLLLALIARARLLGLPVIAAGKSTESDYVWDPEAGTVTAWGRTVPASGYGDRFDPGPALRDRLEARRLPELAVATVPDLCEMTIVANHCGLAPDRPELHAPVARTLELPSLFRPRELGGILEQTGVVDVFACLRRPDELSFAGGVFVVVEAPDPATGRLLGEKGHPVSPDGRFLLLHNPVHLLGVEAIASVLAAVRCAPDAHRTQPAVRQRFDLVGRANRALAAGETLALAARHSIDALDPLIMPAQPASDEACMPYYLAAGHRLRRDVAAGEILTFADIDLDPGSARYRLRMAQDSLF